VRARIAAFFRGLRRHSAKGSAPPREFPGVPSGPPVLYSVRGPGVIRSLAERHPKIAASTIQAAERVLAHEFDLLGSGPFLPRDPDRAPRPSGYAPIDWTLDPVKNLRFPNRVPYKEWRLYEMRPGLADIKHPWELARCQHFPILAQAYRITGRAEFGTEIVDEIVDFMEANPEGVGIHWTSSMDVAIRAANWALALEDLRHAGLEHPETSRAYRALFDHGHFIFENLENHYEVTSNHFLSNVVGLFFVARVFGECPAARSWSEFCRASLEKEIEVQVLPDGADYESSIPYHRLVAELFLSGARLADGEGKPLSESFRQRLASMIDFLLACLRPDGLMPVIGDADDGRLHIFTGYGADDPRDPRHLFGPAACMFDRADWRKRAGEMAEWESAFWGYETLPGEESRDPTDETPSARLFPDAGVAVLRGPRAWLLISNGETGTRGFGNHKHNDNLSFEFHADDGPWIVDPGSYVYTGDPEARNLHRGTAFHSTLQLGHLEQAEMRPDWLFRTLTLSHPEHLECSAERGALKYRGLHRGYARSGDGAVHTRTFTLQPDSGRLIVDDLVSGAFRGPAGFSFHLDPSVSADPGEPGVLQLRRGASRFILRSVEGLDPRLHDAFVSPSYGRRTPSRIARFHTEIKSGEQSFRFVLAPYDAAASR